MLFYNVLYQTAINCDFGNKMSPQNLNRMFFFKGWEPRKQKW